MKSSNLSCSFFPTTFLTIYNFETFFFQTFNVPFKLVNCEKSEKSIYLLFTGAVDDGSKKYYRRYARRVLPLYHACIWPTTLLAPVQSWCTSEHSQRVLRAWHKTFNVWNEQGGQCRRVTIQQKSSDTRQSWTDTSQIHAICKRFRNLHYFLAIKDFKQ